MKIYIVVTTISVKETLTPKKGNILSPSNSLSMDRNVEDCLLNRASKEGFRDRTVEMIMENGINHPEELKEHLLCYLRLNTSEYYDMIIKVLKMTMFS